MKPPVQGWGRGYAPALSQNVPEEKLYPVAVPIAGQMLIVFLPAPWIGAALVGAIVVPPLYRFAKSCLSTVGGEIADLDMLGAETATTEQVRQLGLAPVQRQTMALGQLHATPRV